MARPKTAFAIPANSPVGGKGNAKYPIPDAKHARNAITRVQQFGSPAEKKKVFAAVRRKFPALAKRSTVVPTRSGTGRRYGEKKGTTHRSGNRRR